NFPDTLIIEGKYQVKPDLPFSPGGEVAGDVIEVGHGVKRFQPGDRVAGFCTWGGYAQEIAIPEHAVFPIPSGMTYDMAAGFLIPYGTAYHALVDRGRAQAGE